jgi:hypothetical protein
MTTNVCVWHKADIATAEMNVRFWGKADINGRQSDVGF